MFSVAFISQHQNRCSSTLAHSGQGQLPSQVSHDTCKARHRGGRRLVHAAASAAARHNHHNTAEGLVLLLEDVPHSKQAG
jgi:hypothetical protein